jgi:hypothetical protein
MVRGDWPLKVSSTWVIALLLSGTMGTLQKIRIGQTVAIPAPGVLDHSEIIVSSRGILDVYHDSIKSQIVITGLKAGTAVVSASTGTFRKTVQVVRSSDKKADFKNFMSSRALKKSQGIIKGDLSHHLDYIRLRQFCLTMPCTVDVTLTQKARDLWATELRQKLGPQYMVDVLNTGELIFKTQCLEAKAQTLARSLAKQLMIADAGIFPNIHCLENEDRLFRIQVYLILDRESTLEVSGLAHDALPKDFDQLLSRFRHDSLQDALDIVGSPSIQVLPHRKSRIKSGSEFTVSYQAEDRTQKVWSSFGIDIGITLRLSHLSDRVLIDYRAQLKTPKNRGQNQELVANLLESSVITPLKETTLAGTIDMTQSGLQTTGSLFFSHFPIIGPLFKISESTSGLTKLLLYFKVDELSIPHSSAGPSKKMDENPSKASH